MFDWSVFFECLTILHSQFFLFFALITTTGQHTASAFIYPVSSDHTDLWDCNKIAKGISFILNAYGTNNVKIERVVNRKIHTEMKHAWYNKTLL